MANTESQREEQSTAEPKDTDGQSRKFYVNLQQNAALHSSHFVANLSEDGILLDCSSGFLNRPGTDDLELPIHTRLAIPKHAAVRLFNLLGGILQQAQKQQQQQSADSTQTTPATPAPVSDPSATDPAGANV